jgi:hypothetical protein
MKAEIVTIGDVPDFKIENKPVTRPRTQYNKYPFAKMKVGQSFYIERGHIDVAAVRQAAVKYGNRNGVKFSVVRDGTGYRCGRIA